MNARRLSTVLTLGLLLQACYTYTPIEIGQVTPDMTLRTTLSGAQMDAMADQLPGLDRRVLDGRVAEMDNGELLLDVESMRSQRGGRVETFAQRVRIPAAGILDVQVKERDDLKTYALTAAVVVGVGGAVLLGMEAGRAGESRPGGGSGLDAIVPIFRIPVGR